ncbi:hypothetical protein PAXRUDRAFT_281613 [Paxillus rubicundulus Ve08.2h10]|uniref:Uncharacterized protein n=1 Tax=Paxillus rubicundulus Ve08.2h10 TaxID=930991 RepID=A0A0D0C919_9AGAM|nr:hypothetical protein PAXRUDRAFT_281613 [Paxillus rubicundulus Ve08.2h10]
MYTTQIRFSKRRSLSLHYSRNLNAVPIPPTLANSPHLSSPNSIFWQKSSAPKCPSQLDDEWLGDMVPLDRSPVPEVDTKSEASNEMEPSPTSSSDSWDSDLSILPCRSSPHDIFMTARRVPMQWYTPQPNLDHVPLIMLFHNHASQ